MSLDKWENETGPMSYEEAAARLAEIEGMDIREFLTDGKPDIGKIISKRQTASVKSIKINNAGRVISIELYDENDAGNIYLITSDSGYSKIGFAANMKTRFSAINKSIPDKLTLRHFRWVKQVRNLESILHEKYAHLRIKGEWFNLSSEDLAEAVDLINEYR